MPLDWDMDLENLKRKGGNACHELGILAWMPIERNYFSVQH